jgi:hypothetical protein
MQKEIAATASQEHCALVLASNLSDGAVIAEVLADSSVETINYATVEELLSEARAGVGTIIIAEQALVDDALGLLAEFFAEQPPWSEVPLIILTAHIRSLMPSWRQRAADLPFCAKRDLA